MSFGLRRCLATSSLLVAFAATAVAANAATITVCASGCDHTTIGAAVGAAADGDTISVAAGTYPGSVTIDKSVTLSGAQHGVAAPGRSGATGTESVLPSGTKLTIAADDVTIDGFQIGDVTDANAYKVDDSAGHSNLQVVDNIVRGGFRGVWIVNGGFARITGNLFDANIDGTSTAQAGVWADASHDVQITNNTFTNEVDPGGMSAIQLTTSSAINDAVVGNTFTNNDTAVVLVGGDHVDISRNTGSGFNGSAIFLGLDNKNIWVTANSLTQGPVPTSTGVRVSNAFGAGANARDTNINVLGNTVTGFSYGFRASNAAVGTGVAVHQNNLSANTTAVANEDATNQVDAAHNFYSGASVTGNVFTSALSGPPTSTTSLVDAADTASDVHGCGETGNPCNDLATGIANTVTGGTVQIADGTYTGQFDVWRAMTVSGTTRGGTVLKSPAHGTQVTTVSAGGADQYPVLTLRGGALTSTVQNLTVDGSSASTDSDTGCGVNVDGIAIVDASATIDNTLVEHIRLQSTPPGVLGGCQVGRAIYGRDTLSWPRAITVNNSTVSDYQKNGVDLRGAGLTFAISGNTITDTADATIASNGIVAGQGAGGTITGNTVSGNECDLAGVCGSDPIADTQSTGVLVFDNLATTISGNTVSGNDIGISTGEQGAAKTVAGNPLTTISDNTLDDNRDEGLYLDSGRTTATANTITGGNIGVLAASWSGDDRDSDVNLSGNTISSPTGVEIADTNTSDGFFARVTSHFDDLSGSPEGIDNETSHAVDATNDWFGCSAGPGAAGCSTAGGGGTGDVDTSPHLVLTVSAPVSLETNAAPAAVFATLRQNSDGDVFTRGPSGLTVTFSTTLGSITSGPVTMSNGEAQASFTPGATPGTAGITATLGATQATGSVSVVAPTPPQTTTVTTTAPPQTVTTTTTAPAETVTTTTPAQTVTTTTAGQTITTTTPAQTVVQTVTTPVSAAGGLTPSAQAADTAAQALFGKGATHLSSIENVDLFGKVASVAAKATGKAPVFALGCTTGSCKVALKFQVRYHDAKNHLHTLAVPSQTISLKEAAAKLISVSLNSAARKTLKAAHGLSLKVTIGVTDPATRKVFAVSKTFTLTLATS